MFAVVLLRRRAGRATTAGETPALPAVTIAKPLCGLEPELEENLRSFCELDYPEYEVIFAVTSEDDPAADVASRVMRSNDSVVIAPPIAANEKVSSLIAIERRAKYPILVVADSDIRVQRDYLRKVVAAFDGPSVGGVTAVYSGKPTRTAAARLGAMYINESFLPSVLVATVIQHLDFFLGATMAVRRDGLRAIGGFEALAHDLADDYRLGQRLRERGYKIRLADVIVETTVSEHTIADLLRREIRWSRTIRTVRPVGHFLTILTMPLVWAVIVLIAGRFSPLACIVAAAALAVRIGIHVVAPSPAASQLSPEILRPAQRGEEPALSDADPERSEGKAESKGGPKGRMRATSLIWIPIRDALTFFVYCASFFGRSVVWRERRFDVSADGQLHAAKS
ncbi:MAG: hypothetical protein DMF58_18795 [Acidobacteria bacterium]|nr:MAG: hypothetical protein DMF58_18795 [Acidobacteriota bacterium]